MLKNIKSYIFILSLVLALSISWRVSGQNTSIGYGTNQEILNTTSTGAVTGATFALPAGANVIGFSHINETSPTSVSVNFQVSFDGSAWTTLANSAGLAVSASIAGMHNTGVSAYRFIRATQPSRVGGTRTLVYANVVRAYPITTGGTTSPVLSGNLLFSPDNTYDIGGSGGTNRPRALYTAANIDAGTSVQSSAVSIIGWSTRSRMFSDANGTIRLSNNAGTDFSRLQFGGTTSAFPALGRSSGILQVLTADAGNFAPLEAATLRLSTSTAFASLGASTNGTIVYCSDCTIANPCAAGGTGAIAKRLNSVWVCN